MSRDIYQNITDRFVEQLEKDTVPCQKPWFGVQNMVSRKQYRGINSLLLGSSEFQSPFWVTFKQALNLGGHIKKGEKSMPVIRSSPACLPIPQRSHRRLAARPWRGDLRRRSRERRGVRDFRPPVLPGQHDLPLLPILARPRLAAFPRPATPVKRATLLTTGQELEVRGDAYAVEFHGLPKKSPTAVFSVIKVELAGALYKGQNPEFKEKRIHQKAEVTKIDILDTRKINDGAGK